MNPSASLDHPRSRTRGNIIALAALAAGPAAWILQLVAGYGVASHACFPRFEPARQSPPPGWSGETPLLLALNLVCLAIALAGLALSWRMWRQARPAAEGRGRARSPQAFLAACGAAGGVGFALAILFDTAPILGVPACWSIVQ